MLTKQLLDHVMMQSGIPFNIADSLQRNYSLMEMLMDSRLSLPTE